MTSLQIGLVASEDNHGGQQQYNGMREMSPTEHATLKRKGNFEIFFHWIISFPISMFLTFLSSLDFHKKKTRWTSFLTRKMSRMADKELASLVLQNVNS